MIGYVLKHLLRFTRSGSKQVNCEQYIAIFVGVVTSDAIIVFFDNVYFDLPDPVFQQSNCDLYLAIHPGIGSPDAGGVKTQ